MLADLIGAPASAIRHWQKTGALRAESTVHRLPYFSFSELGVARKLAALASAGCSLRQIDSRLAELARTAPEIERPLADPEVLVVGRRLVRRRGADLAETGGQLLLDFDSRADDDSAEPATITLPSVEQLVGGANESESSAMEAQALEADNEGRLAAAADGYRAAMLAGGPTPDLCFALADVLYRAGDLAAARERYYAAIELDEAFVEARVGLGCVLSELGELELAVAAFEGALDRHHEYADARFHLAAALDRLGQSDEADDEYRAFLSRAPESPWADAVRRRLKIAAPLGVES